MGVLEDVSDQARLMRERRHGASVEPPLGILTDQEPCLKTIEAALRLRVPVVLAREAREQVVKPREGLNSTRIDAYFELAWR